MDAPGFVNACCPKVVLTMGRLKVVCLRKYCYLKVSLFMYGGLRAVLHFCCHNVSMLLSVCMKLACVIVAILFTIAVVGLTIRI